MRRKRKNKFLSNLRKLIIVLMMLLSCVVFVMASCQIVIANPYGTIAMILSSLYILLFCWANEVE